MTSQKLLEDLLQAYYDARRNKRNTINQLKFEMTMEERLVKLHSEIANRTYKIGRSVAFIIEEPVKREVFAASFADRVIHHLFYNYTNELFERSFIDDCYSCRKGKGTSYGIGRLDHHIRSCSQNYTRDAYVLKLDLSGYFMNIDRRILHEKVVDTLNRYATRKNSRGVRFCDALDYDLLRFLTKEIVFHDPLDDCFIRGDMSEWNGLPPDKSLFTSPRDCGLPIGNLTSQLFSNVYLNDFDHWVKRELKVQHYGRYVDDFFLIHPSKEFLVDAIDRIRDYLWDDLGIRLHPRKIYLQHIRRGVPFLGVIVKPHRIYVSRRTSSNFKRALDKGEHHYRKHPDELRSVLNSYLGLTYHYKTFRLRSAIIEKHPWIYNYGWRDANYRKFHIEI